MCGIVGYIGNKKAKPVLIDGLLKLEYRGYDSAGIATLEDWGISNIKDKGRVNNLYKVEGFEDLEGTVGIAHTRWATHGKPSKENSHPHMDNSNTFSVVHNGIIENYNELRKFLTEEGYKFLSQTDTEVIPNLIHYYYEKEADNENKLLKAVNKACKDFKGSYAIEVISKLHPGMMVVAKKDSPLVIGKGENENYVASDIPAILAYSKEVYVLNDNEFAELTSKGIEFFDKDLNKIKKETKLIEWDATAAEKEGFEDFMLKEIYEQPKTVKATIGSRINLGEKTVFDELNFSKEFLSSLNKICIVACGTAMHAGLAAKPVLEKLLKISVEVDIASEFRYRDPLVNEKTLVIFISQSGETADTIAALKLAKQKGAKTLAISNVIGSSITGEADFSIYTHAGPEIAVASTKAYTSQIVLMNILGIYCAEVLESADKEQIEKLKQDILELPQKIEVILQNTEQIKDFAKRVCNQKDMFFLGRGLDYTTALEASLKLKEISYIHSEAYAAGELKHGPIALIENGVTVIGILTDEKLVEKSISNIQEVITRGANTLIVTNQELDKSNYKKVIEIPETNTLISPVLSIIPLQLFSYYVSKEKGLDVDKPRNLAKSVTVE